MKARDLMQRDVIKILEDETVDELIALLVGEHLHGVPVLDGDGTLVGMVTQQDIFFGTMTRDRAGGETEEPPGNAFRRLKVKDIMTSPAVSVDEDTDLRKLCRLMERLRIHRVPVVLDGKMTGIVAALDVCAAVARGTTIS